MNFGIVNDSSAKRGSLGVGATNVFCAKTSANLAAAAECFLRESVAAAAGCFLREWTPLHLASDSHILTPTANFHHLVDGLAWHTKKELSQRKRQLFS